MSLAENRVLRRLRDIADAIAQIEVMLDGKTYDDFRSDRILRAAYERFIEIISEASRHIPAELQAKAPEVPWARVRAIGNPLRHAYHEIDGETLWNIYSSGELAILGKAFRQLIEIAGRGDENDRR